MFVNQCLYLFSKRTQFQNTIYALICHLQHTWKSIQRWRPPHTVCAILQTTNWQQSGDLYVLLLWNRRTYRSLYTTKQATEFINLHCQHTVFQSKERSLSLSLALYIYIYIYIYTGCNRRNRPDFGRVFLMLNYTEKPQNTHVQSWTVWEILAIENVDFLRVQER